MKKRLQIGYKAVPSLIAATAVALVLLCSSGCGNGTPSNGSNEAPSGNARRAANSSPSGNARRAANSSPSGNAQQTANSSPSGNARQAAYIPPKIPSLLKGRQEQLEYLAVHFWQSLDFTDTTLLHTTDLEQLYVNYLNILQGVTPQTAGKSLRALVDTTACSSPIFRKFTEMSEKYLYNPNSPLRNDELYIIVLQKATSLEGMDPTRKAGWRRQLALCMKNRPGTKATDFSFLQRNGTTSRLHQIKGKFIVLYFNNPGCGDCKRVGGILRENAIFKHPDVRILSIFPDNDAQTWYKQNYPAGWINGFSQDFTHAGLYDLKAIPTLYLLDSSKTILLKDAPVEHIARTLQQLLK